MSCYVDFRAWEIISKCTEKTIEILNLLSFQVGSEIEKIKDACINSLQDK